MKRSLSSLVGAAVFAVACSGQKPATSPPPPASAMATAPGNAKSEFGVPECDRFVQKYLACLEKVPESTRAMVRQGFDQSRESWKRAAATPEGRAGLTTACQQAEAASQMAMQAYGCRW